jgi:predicted RND superfamily exporter protein
LLAGLVRAIWQHPRRILAVTLAIALGAGALASRLSLRSSLADLLQSDDPAAREFHRIAERLPSTLTMVIAIEGPDRDANLRAAAAVAARLDALRPALVDTVLGDLRAERAFFDAHKWLYADLATLVRIRDAVRGAIARAKNPLLVEIDDDASPRALLEQATHRASEIDRFPSGFFEADAGRLVIVLVRPARGMIGEDVGRELRDATQRIAGELTADPRIGPQVHVALGGNMIVQLEERAALMRDLARASLACLVLVALVVFGFFGRLRVVALFAMPALIGVTVGYGMAALVWGFVNLSAAFMATIIVGNGINFAIIQQARYDEERQRGAAALDAAITAVRTTAGATLVAALGAAIAYGSLTLTRFRGFSQFGAIGATGMIAAWLATLIVLPALWALLDAGPARRRFRSLADARWLGWFGRRPGWLLAAGALLAIASIARLPSYFRDPFEYDLTRLRNRTAAAAAVSAKAERVFGETVAPHVVLAERRDDAPEIQRRLRERAATSDGKRLLSTIRTVDDLIPADQDARLAVLGELRTLLDSPELRDEADPQLQHDLARLRPPDALRPIAVADLPRTIRRLFSEVDGTIGRIVLIYDHPRLTAYDGHAQLALADLIGEVPLARGAVARGPVLFAGLIRGIVHDAPIATGLSLLGVIALVALFDRTRRGVALVIGALVLGVVWMIGAAAWFGVRVNFLNFIALPITFGIGVDYGINMYRRCRLEGPGEIGRAVRAVGGALVLCSSTTVIGYGSLLFADNQALGSFGAMAILGEVATLLAAITMLPAALQLWSRTPAVQRLPPP